MSPTIEGLLISFVVLLLAFRALQLLQPKGKRLQLLRRGFWTDLVYWAFTPLVTRAITRVSVIVAVVPVAWLIYGKVDKELLLQGFGPAPQLPPWQQAPPVRRSRLALGRAPAPRERRADAHRRHAARAGAGVRAGGGCGHRPGPDA